MTELKMTAREQSLATRRVELQKIVAAGKAAEAELHAIDEELKARPMTVTEKMALLAPLLAKARDKVARTKRAADDASIAEKGEPDAERS